MSESPHEYARDQWIKLTPEQAMQHPFYDLKFSERLKNIFLGLMFLNPILGLAIFISANIISKWRYDLHVPAFSYISAIVPYAIIFFSAEYFGQLLKRHNPLVIPLLIALGIGVTVIRYILACAVFYLYPESREYVNPVNGLKGSGTEWLLTLAVWLPVFLCSKRFNATIFHRVKARHLTI